MAKRQFRKSADDLFNEGQSEGNSWLDTSSQIFGDLAAIDAATERIHKISIFDITPDHQQPRRAIPSQIRRTWDGTAQSVTAMLHTWLREVETERGQAFDLGAYLDSEETERSQEEAPGYTPGPLEQGFLMIVNLAASIRRDGLTNPITVAAIGGRYQLETGERRWLAYHLLHSWFDGSDDRPDETQDWKKIPARQVGEVDVWRQASENNARANLNAISKARQWAVLMMDLNDDASFKPFQAFKNEREFYAQAVDARVPYGKGEQIMSAMGINSRSALARYRALLKLPDMIWSKGDDLNLPEEQLYGLARLPHEEALKKFEQIVAGQNNSENKQSSLDAIAPVSPGTKRHFALMTRSIKGAGHGKHKQNAQALKTLRELRLWLEEQESRILKYLE